MSANTNKRLVAIVTGASSGMGLGITRALLERGYRVVANSRTISQSRELKPSADLVLVDCVITKSTVPAFSRALAMEFVADGIRANTISPGAVDTPMHANDDHEVLKKLSPAGRLIQISDIVDAVLYLESAPMVNGENIRVDGGAHAGAKW